MHAIGEHVVALLIVDVVSLLRDGWNEISVENGGDQTITVVALELAVRSAATAGQA
jgi:hypothetical protein